MAAESIYEALIECVKAAGGSKAVAAKLWPAKAARDIDDARRYLAGCLNPDRQEKLSLDEVLLILSEARTRGCHVGMQFLAATLSYAEPQPVEPKDEADELRRQFIESTRALAKMAERIESLERPAAAVRAVA